MTGKHVTLNAVSVVHVPKQDDVSHICTLDSDELKENENKDIRNLAKGVVSNIIQDNRFGDGQRSPKYGNSKSARIQNIGNGLAQNKKQVFACIERVRTAEQMKADAKSLGKLYKKQSQSRGDALVIASYEYQNEDCAAVLKIPYKDDVYQTGEDDVTEAKRIIEQDVDKSLIYPSVDPKSGKSDKNAMKSYQSGSSTPANYWQEFAGLERSPTPDEKLLEHVSRGDAPFIESSTIDELRNRQEELEEDVLEGKVKVSIGEIQFKTKLRNILDPEQFEVQDEGENTTIELRGRRARFTAKQGRDEYSILSSESQ